MITFELRIILVFLTAFFSALFVLPKLADIARRIGLVDHPNSRKVHTIPRPLVGGIGMTIAATFSALTFVSLQGLRGYFLGLAVLLLVGFLDDFKEIGHRQKFAAQIAATALLMWFCKVYLLSFGDLLGFGSIDLPQVEWFIWAVTIFCVVGVINSINMIDGLDGLAGGLSFIAFLSFAIHASFAGNQSLMLLNLALAGAVLAFLRFNWYPSSLFMGDAGSLCLGFSLAFMALALTQGEQATTSPVVALLILAVPITDTISVMVKRILKGESPFKADQYHLHHIFMRMGMEKKGAVKVILLLSIGLSCCGLLGPIYNFQDRYLFLIFCLYMGGYLLSSFYIIYLMRHGRRLKKIQKNWKSLKSLRAFFVNFDILKIFRKSTRYDVDLQVVCWEETKEEAFHGKVRNISSDGFLAELPELNQLSGKMIAEITFPFGSGVHRVELPCEHLWISGEGAGPLHGFRIYDFDGDQQQIVFKFLVKYKKKKLK